MESSISLQTFGYSRPSAPYQARPNDDLDEAHTLGQLRRDLLAQMDSARFSWFQAKVCVVAGVGFFTDAYDMFAISIAVVMIGLVYPGRGCHAGPYGYKMGRNDELLIKLGTPLGNLFGQVAFGWLADILGRKRMYGYELIIIIVSTFGQAIASPGPGVNFYVLLFTWRFFLGLGIGGDYPLSAIIASEFSATRYRGRMMTAVFAAQGWGTLAAALAAVIIVTANQKRIDHPSVSFTCSGSTEHTDLTSIDSMWRLLIGLGCVPAAIALYFRLTIPETPRFSLDVEGDLPRAFHDVHSDVLSLNSNISVEVPRHSISVPRATWRDFRGYFGEPANFKVLFATAYCWFALDIAYYGLGLNQATILQNIGFGNPKTDNVYKYLQNIAIGNLVVIAAGLLPGYWATFCIIDSWGRKPVQYMGFIALTIIFLILGFAFDLNTLQAEHKTPKSMAFVFLYCLANFFFNFGPNVTTFVIPGEVFPTRYRSTGHGISAASGKLGAVVAQIVFHLIPPSKTVLQVTQWVEGTSISPDDDSTNKRAIRISLIIFAFVMLTGVAGTYLLPEPKQKSLEELSNEDQKAFVRGSSRNSSS